MRTMLRLEKGSSCKQKYISHRSFQLVESDILITRLHFWLLKHRQSNRVATHGSSPPPRASPQNHLYTQAEI